MSQPVRSRERSRFAALPQNSTSSLSNLATLKVFASEALEAMSDDTGHRSSAAALRLLEMVDAFTAEMNPRGHVPRSVTLDSHFESDLGLDSLARTELLSRIEKAFGTRFPIELFGTAATSADVLQAIEATPVLPRESATLGDALQSSPGALDPPATAQTLIDALEWHVSRRPACTHIVLLDEEAPPRTITYEALYEAALRISRGLRALGVNPGETVALMLPTGSDYFACFAGIMLAGAVVVPVYPLTQEAHLDDHLRRHAAILANARVRVMIVPPHAGAASMLVKASVPMLRKIVAPRQLEGVSDSERYVPHAQDVAFLQYTSGSTGAPKGVIVTHANLLANIRAMGRAFRIGERDVLASWLPLYHDMGLIGAWFAPLYYGIPLVLMSPLTFLARPERWLQAISRYRATITPAPNFAYERCARRLSDAELAGVNLSSVRLAVCGAEPVSARTMRAFAARFASYGFDSRALTPVYGLAENTLDLTFSAPGRGMRTNRISRARLADAQRAERPESDDDAIELVGCGTPLAGSEIRIVGPGGDEVSERQVGRIEFRGASATRGYYRNPEQTARLIHDGWLDTGDLGYVADGELFITGRVKDLVIRAGQHFFPYELEEAIGRSPGVRNGCVAVCGMPDAAAGTDRLIVIAETRETNPPALAAIRAGINAAAVALLGTPPEEVALVPPHSILKTSSGKIRHAATLDLYLRSRGRLEPCPRWQRWLNMAAGTLWPICCRAGTEAAHVAYGVYCWLVLALVAIPAWLMTVWHPNTDRNWAIASRASRLFLALARLRVTVHGAKRYTASRAPIFVANHASYLDGLVLLAALPEPVAMVAKRGLSGQWIAGSFLRALGVRFVERHDYSRSVADERELVARAVAGDALLFFPEGTFVRSAGLRQFRLGAFVAACQSRRPVVPIAIAGTRAALRDGEWLPRRADITVTVLDPLQPEGEDIKAAANLRDAARDTMPRYCGESLLSAAAL
jgi:fatty-acyl-CoA synthase